MRILAHLIIPLEIMNTTFTKYIENLFQNSFFLMVSQNYILILIFQQDAGIY